MNDTSKKWTIFIRTFVRSFRWGIGWNCNETHNTLVGDAFGVLVNKLVGSFMRLLVTYDLFFYDDIQMWKIMAK